MLHCVTLDIDIMRSWLVYYTVKALLSYGYGREAPGVLGFHALAEGRMCVQ